MRTWDNPEYFLNEIPDGWQHDRLKDVVSLREIRTDEKSDVEDYLELEDIESGTGQIISRRNTLGVESDVTCFRKGDVLFGKLRPYLGKYFLADFDGKCTGEILAFAPKRIEGHFLRYCVAAPWFIEKCNSLAYGAKMPRVNWAKQLALFDIPLPSREAQRRIAAYLDKACAAIDGAIRAKQQQLEVLDDLRKSIIHKAVTRGLDEKPPLRDSECDYLTQVPKHWEVIHLKRVCSRIQTGTTPPTDNPDYYEEGSIPWYAPGSYNQDIRLTSPSKVINKKAVDDNVLRMFPANTIFLVGIGATIGKVGITVTNASCNQQITGLVCLSRVIPLFLAYQLKIYEQIIPNMARFTTLPIMDQARIGYLRIAVPPRREQEQIALFLDREMEELSSMKKNLLNQIATAEQYRKSLIHECVTGKRRIE